MDFKEMGLAFRELADLCDEIVATDERLKNGGDCQEELESLQGKFLLKMLKLQNKL